MSAIAMLGAIVLAGCRNEAGVADVTWCSSDPSLIPPGFAAAGVEFGLTEVWRSGADASQPLTQPNTPSVSESGEVAVPDPSASAVMIVGPDGTWYGNVVRRGQGPGEFTWPAEVAWTSGGNLLVFDLVDGSVTELDLEADSVVSRFLVNRALYSRLAQLGQVAAGDLSGDGSLYLELPPDEMESRPGFSLITLVRLAADERVDTVSRTPVQMVDAGRLGNWKRPGGPYPIFAASHSGALAVGGESGRYRIRVLTSELKDSMVLCRDVPSPPLHPTERGEVPPEVGVSDDGSLDLLAVLEEVPVPEETAPFGGIFFGERGRVWVLRDRPDPARFMMPPEGGTYDVFAADGSYLGHTRAPERTVLVGEGGGQVYGLSRGSFDEAEVVAYRLEGLSGAGLSDGR